MHRRHSFDFFYICSILGLSAHQQVWIDGTVARFLYLDHLLTEIPNSKSWGHTKTRNIVTWQKSAFKLS
jgi:hypothetical protein